MTKNLTYKIEKCHDGWMLFIEHRHGFEVLYRGLTKEEAENRLSRELRAEADAARFAILEGGKAETDGLR